MGVAGTLISINAIVNLVGDGQSVAAAPMTRAAPMSDFTRYRHGIRLKMHTGPAWILGVAMALLVLLGLIIASHAADPIMYYVGLGFCFFGVLFNYGLIARHSGKNP